MATAGTACPARCRGLFYGDASQLAAQAVGTLTCFVWVFVTFFAFFKIVEALMGNRVSAEVELEGLDIPEMGALAYPDFVLLPTGSPALAHAVATPAAAPVSQGALKPVQG